jgi:arginine/lysine/ornithine decarboxylase
VVNRTIEKATRRIQSELAKRQGPAEKDQAAAPIADAMRHYWESGMLTFGIPAHNGARGPEPEFVRWAGAGAARSDLPMSHGVDTRNRAWEIQSTAQELFADAVGSQQTLFSTGGSSLSVRVAIMTVAGPGETLVMARNGHKSAFAGLILSGARPVYVDPYYDEELEIALGPLARDLATVLDAHPDAAGARVHLQLLRHERRRERACGRLPRPRIAARYRRRLGIGLQARWAS